MKGVGITGNPFPQDVRNESGFHSGTIVEWSQNYSIAALFDTFCNAKLSQSGPVCTV